MKKYKPTYEQLEKRLAVVEPIIEAFKNQEVDAVVGHEKIAFLMLRRVEEAWLETSGEFAAMFELDGIGMIQADAPAFRFSRVNSKFCEITGYTTEELLTRTYIDLTHPEDRKKGLAAVAQVIRGKSNSWSIEKRWTRKDGDAVWVHLHGSVLRDQSGRAVRIMAMVEDITSRKQAGKRQPVAQDQLQEQLDERTSGMAHMRRTMHSKIARRKLADHVLRAIQEFLDRSPESPSDVSSANRTRPGLRTRKATVKTRKKKAKRGSAGTS